MPGGYGTQNLGNPYNPYQDSLSPDDINGYLKRMSNDIQAIRNDVVTPKLFKRQKVKLLAVGTTNESLLCDNVPVQRIYIQCFTTSGLLSIFFTANVGASDIPDLQIGNNPFPTVIPFPGQPVDVTIRNDGTVPASYSVFLSSAGG